LRELPQRLHYPLRRTAGTRVGDDAGVVEREHLAVVTRQPRLVVVGIDVTDAALHEQEDDALGAGWKVRRLGREWVGDASVSERRPRVQPCQRQRPEPAGA